MSVVAWFPSGKKFAGGGYGDRTVYIYTRDGQQQSKHKFDIPYEYVRGLTVVSDTQMVVVASTGYSLNKYRLYMLGVTGNALQVQW
jgi:WD40 repeat protein